MSDVHPKMENSQPKFPGEFLFKEGNRTTNPNY
jgi:hypothetical protein